MNRRISDIIPGLAIFLLIAVVIGFSVSMGAFPGGVEEWLSGSANPRQALITFSAALSSLTLMLVRSGVEISPLNFAKGENLRRYITGLPFWFLIFCFAISLLGFWNFSPSCKAPEAVTFKIVGTDQSYQPLDLLEVSPNQPMTIMAVSPDEAAQLSCISWEFVGPAFPTLGEKNGCQVNITFGDQSGPSFISLLATQNFCNNATLFSLEVQVK
ncbi:MAG: hypothetical protein IPG80_08725 [Anaerolineales bacterium]|jgi:hypothetical protein|uniref:hypothetical protein n=1 Tax=Candidatus Villigracilis vicinus TaxID=3140679 RepID=UPI0031352496|nr:hypothetical protein [Anaerolineales bacterium]MBK7449439.1 hypothetical protein [Anaerolineales bacterium]MBK9780495.1 hypothetical protein [Anaerolineales bacterium]